MSDVTQLTCGCGTFIPDAWGPDREFRAMNGEYRRVQRCPGCGRTLAWRMGPDGVPDSMHINPLDPNDGIARWDRAPLLPLGTDMVGQEPAEGMRRR